MVTNYIIMEISVSLAQEIPFYLELIVGIMSGILSGIIATLCLYIRITKFKPKFDISDVIVENNGKYKFKIQNASKRTLLNIHIRITYRTPTNGSPTFTNDKVPILRGMKEDGVEKKYFGMYESEIEIDEVRKRKVTSYVANINKKNELEQEEQTQKESIKEFFDRNKDRVLEIVITYDDPHKIFGNVQRLKTKQYKGIECIRFNSRFIDGTMTTREIDFTEYINDK